MKKETRSIYYDEDLHIEAYRFEGITQPFPLHFHDYYVIGFVENGARCLTCEAVNYSIQAGDIILFNPRDNHACSKVNGETLDYRAFTIKAATMDALVKEITGKKFTLHFNKHIIRDSELLFALRALHKMIMHESKEFEKDVLLFCTIEQLIQECGVSFDNSVAEYNSEIETACFYMQQNFANAISLDELCKVSALSKATLIRAFTKAKGISPYRYLENIRLGEAKKCLERGETLVEAAFSTGFSDQAHFSHFFKNYIGLTPKQYRDSFKPKRQTDDKTNPI